VIPIRVSSDTLSGYERRLLRRIEEIEKELEEYHKLAKRLREKQVLGISNLHREVLEQVILANVKRKQEELEEIKKQLDLLYYRVGIYLGKMGKKLDRFARSIGKSKSQVVREALEEYMAKYGW